MYRKSLKVKSSYESSFIKLVSWRGNSLIHHFYLVVLVRQRTHDISINRLIDNYCIAQFTKIKFNLISQSLLKSHFLRDPGKVIFLIFGYFAQNNEKNIPWKFFLKNSSMLPRYGLLKFQAFWLFLAQQNERASLKWFLLHFEYKEVLISLFLVNIG